MRLKSPWRTLASLALVAAAALLALPAAAQALPEDRAYEMVSPPDKNDGDVGAGLFVAEYYAGTTGDRVGYMALGGWDSPANSITGVYIATRGEEFWVSKSGFLPVLPFANLGGAAVQSISPDASHVITSTNRNPDTGEPFDNGEWGAAYLLNVETGERDLLIPPRDVNDDPVGSAFAEYVGTPDYSRLFFTGSALLTEDAPDVPGSSGSLLYLFEDGELSLEGRLPGGGLTRAQLPNPGSTGLSPNPASADGQVIHFMVPFQAGAGEDHRGLYRRDFSGASPQTVRVNEPETAGDPGGTPTANFSGASADGDIVYFTSNQKLVDEDADNFNDLYRYEHSQPAGSRLTLISQDNEPDDEDRAVDRVHTVSDDGSTVVFSSGSQLVDGESTEAGQKLYVARNGTVDFIGITGPLLTGEISAEGVALSDDGSQLAFLTNAELTEHDNGGFDQVYVRDNDTGEIECASCLDGAANTAQAEFQTPPSVGWFGSTRTRDVRNLSSEGHVFFQTAEALLPRDTNEKIDVYVWQDGELDLISTGRSTDNSKFASATPDGKDVFFVTREKLSGWDFDDHLDLYTARVDGGLPEPLPGEEECAGSDCQGPPPLPPAFPDPGTGDADGPGNADPAPVDCTSAERKANRLANKAQQASKKAKRLGKRAKKAQRQAKAKRKQARQARNQLALCREEAEL